MSAIALLFPKGILIFVENNVRVETPDYIYVLELKLDGTAREVIDQINAKGYAREYESDPRKLYKIGINFSSETGTVSDWLVE